MTTHLHLLASGSSGNSSLLEVGGFGILIDFGLPRARLAERLHARRLDWAKVHAVLLTHTHADHWNSYVLPELRQRKIPLYCTREHAADLERLSRPFRQLQDADLVHLYQVDQAWELGACRCQPFALSHDGQPTVGFRFEQPGAWSVGYAADLGCWSEQVADHLANVDVLAVEFNHDVRMQRSSGRPYHLIRRVLGDEGHLSNEQAADLVRAVVARSEPGRLKHLVQLHLSQECNRPKLALAAGEAACPASVAVIATTQHVGGPSIDVLRVPTPRASRPQAYVQCELQFG